MHLSDYFPANKHDIKKIERLIMALSDDLQNAVDDIVAKNDALIALVQQLVAAAQNNPPAAGVQAAIDKLKAEAAKDDAILNPAPPPTP